MEDASLERFVERVNGEGRLRVEEDFGGGFVRLRTSEAERRQAAQDIRSSEDIVLELLRNARDAHASNIFLASSKTRGIRTLVVIDDGEGIPASMHERIFEARVTSKLNTSHTDKWGYHGRGMALYSVRQNAQAQVASSDVNLGTSIVVHADVSKLAEKADQSSFPRFSQDETGMVHVLGPKNIVRTACEFAIEEHAQCNVYLGSIAEIAASIFAYGVRTMTKAERAFCTDANALPLVKRLAVASDPAEFQQMAAQLGLVLSERTARRILDGDIHPAPNMLNQISIDKPRATSSTAKRTRASVVKLQPEDKAAMAAAAKSAYADIAGQYYLNPDVDPSVRVDGSKLVIDIPLVPAD